MYRFSINGSRSLVSRFFLVIAMVGSVSGLAQSQPESKVKPLPLPAVTNKADTSQAIPQTKPVKSPAVVGKSESAPAVKANPLTKEKPATLPVLKKTDPSLPAVTAAPISSVKITSLKTTPNPGLVQVTGILTHNSLAKAGKAQTCFWSMQAWEGGQWHDRGFLQGGKVSVGPNESVTVRGYFSLGANRIHYSPRGGSDWGWSLSGLDLRERPTKFRLKVSLQQPGMIQVNPKFAGNQEEKKEIWFGKFVVQYRCANWQTSAMLEFDTPEAEFNAGRPALTQLGFEFSSAVKERGKYLTWYRCANWAERAYVTMQEAERLQTHLMKLTGVEVRIQKR